MLQNSVLSRSFSGLLGWVFLILVLKPFVHIPRELGGYCIKDGSVVLIVF